MAKKTPKLPALAGPGNAVIEVHPADYDFANTFMLIVGPPKSGKTSTAAALKSVSDHYDLGLNPFFMLFEKGSGGVDVLSTSEMRGKESVRKILSTTDEIEAWFKWVADQPELNPVVIDTGDAMFQVVQDSICVEMGIPDPTASDYGAAWTKIADRWRELFSFLIAADKCIIVLMHVYYKEKRVGAGTISTASFSISGKSGTWLAGAAHQILLFDTTIGEDNEDKRVIIAESRAGIEAGDQWGVMPAEMDRGNNPEMAAAAILSRFYEDVDPEDFVYEEE